MSVILATQEAEIRMIVFQSQPRQIVCETLSQNKPSRQKRAGGVAQGVGPEFKPQYRKNKQQKNQKKPNQNRNLFLIILETRMSCRSLFPGS
jgi:hypothetical protein